MTPNQKKALSTIRELENNGQPADVYAVSGAVRASCHYAEDILKELLGGGYVTRGPYKQYATRYTLTEKGREKA